MKSAATKVQIHYFKCNDHQGLQLSWHNDMVTDHEFLKAMSYRALLLDFHLMVEVDPNLHDGFVPSNAI